MHRVRTAPVPRLHEASDGLDDRGRFLANVVIGFSTCMAVIDGNVANVALPTIARDLHVDATASIWVVSAFQLALCTTLLPFSALGDLIGYRRVYLPGIVVFTLGSLGCAIAPNLTVLVLARVLQGFGASGILAIEPALYRRIYPQARLGRGFALSALIVATSSAAAPTLGGIILAVASWPWIFAINVPIGCVAILIALRCIPHTPRRDERLDIASTALSATSLGFLVMSLDAVARRVPAYEVAVLACAGTLAGIIFLVRQTRIAHPLLWLPLFRNRRFSLAGATSFTAFVAQGSAFVALPFFMRETLHASPLLTGALLSSWPLATIVAARLTGLLSERIAAPVMTTLGLAVFGAGLALVAAVPSDAAPSAIVGGGLVCGFGFGLFQAPNNRELLANVPSERSGNAAGILATVRTLGQALGAALVALIVGQGSAGPAVDLGTRLAAPLHLTLALAAAAALAACVVSGLRLTDPACRRLPRA